MDRQELMESIRAYQPFNEQGRKMDKSPDPDWIGDSGRCIFRDNTVAHMTALSLGG